VTDAIAAATSLIEALAPGGRPVTLRTPLERDESRWFLAAADQGILRFEDCPPDCFRRRKWGVSGPDHFRTPAGKPRHLFSKPVGDVAWLNREYVPHLAAFALAVLQGGFDASRASFSLYRRFSRDLVAKRSRLILASSSPRTRSCQAGPYGSGDDRRSVGGMGGGVSASGG
jgi:hypothetical protein